MDGYAMTLLNWMGVRDEIDMDGYAVTVSIWLGMQ